MKQYINYPWYEFSNDCTEFRLYDFEKWIAQNEGIITNCIEGNLLDNYIVECKNGIAFIFEKCVNTWTSCNYVYFFRKDKTESEKYKQIEKEWNELEQAYYEEMEG